MVFRDLEFAPDSEISKRRNLAVEFFKVALDPEEHPWFISDEASIYDIYAGDENDLVAKCKSYYGVDIRDQLGVPLWKLLDYLTAYRSK
jgi:hypothetical protein